MSSNAYQSVCVCLSMWVFVQVCVLISLRTKKCCLLFGCGFSLKPNSFTLMLSRRTARWVNPILICSLIEGAL